MIGIFLKIIFVKSDATNTSRIIGISKNVECSNGFIPTTLYKKLIHK